MSRDDPQGPFVLCYDGSQAVEELDAPGIVIGQRGLSGLNSAVLGSISREVINAYHPPVVVA
jgi:nucleotide-binding universal stress UspA family protein